MFSLLCASVAEIVVGIVVAVIIVGGCCGCDCGSCSGCGVCPSANKQRDKSK